MIQIFSRRPVQWGFRGDPLLWSELENHFQTHELPGSVSEFRAVLERTIERLTGCDLDSDEPVFVERYDSGGMSSGHVSPGFWRETAIPLLCERFSQLADSSSE